MVFKLFLLSFWHPMMHLCAEELPMNLFWSWPVHHSLPITWLVFQGDVCWSEIDVFAKMKTRHPTEDLNTEDVCIFDAKKSSESSSRLPHVACFKYKCRLGIRTISLVFLKESHSQVFPKESHSKNLNQNLRENFSVAKTSQKIHLQAFWGETQKKLPQMHDPKKNAIFSWFLGTFEEADLDNSGTMEVPSTFFPEEMGREDEDIDTIDGRNPAPPGMYKTLWILWYRSYINWCRISAMNSMTYIPKQTGWMVQGRPLMTAGSQRMIQRLTSLEGKFRWWWWWWWSRLGPCLTKPTKKTVGLSHFPLSCIFVLDEIDFGKKKQTNIYTMQFITNNSPFEECIVQKQIWGCSSRASNMDWFSEQQMVISRLQWLDGFVRFWEQVARRSHISNHPSASLDTYQVFIAGSNGLIWFFTTFFQSHGTWRTIGFILKQKMPFHWSWRIISGKSYSDVNIEETPFQKGNE